jgi:hypothetical protein
VLGHLTNECQTFRGRVLRPYPKVGLGDFALFACFGERWFQVSRTGFEPLLPFGGLQRNPFLRVSHKEKGAHIPVGDTCVRLSNLPDIGFELGEVCDNFMGLVSFLHNASDLQYQIGGLNIDCVTYLSPFCLEFFSFCWTVQSMYLPIFRPFK